MIALKINRARAGLPALLAAVMVSSAWADVVYYTDGRVKEGTVLSETEDEVVFEMVIMGMKASIRIPRHEIDRVEITAPQEQSAPAQEKKEESASSAFLRSMRDARELLDAKKYRESAARLEALLDGSGPTLNSLQKKDVFNDLIRCYECLGAWDKASETYERLLKSPVVGDAEVAVTRVKQRILRENPDGMMDLSVYEPKEGQAKPASGEPTSEKRPLSDPQVMALMFRGEAEIVLREAEKKMAKADAQATFEKLWSISPLTIIGDLAKALTGPKSLTIKGGDAIRRYEESASDAVDADYLVPGISTPLRLKIALKRAGLVDDEIKKARRDVESHSYYRPPPPPNATEAQKRELDRQQSLRLQGMNVTADAANKFRELVNRVQALEDWKLEILQPFSDHILKQIEDLQRERDELANQAAQAERVAELADTIKENEKLEAQFAEMEAKARASQPSRFEYGYEKFMDGAGIYRFKKDSALKWRLRTDECVGYCRAARNVGVKRIKLLQKFPDRPQFVRDIDNTKSRMVQIYQLEQNVLAERDKKGRSTG